LLSIYCSIFQSQYLDVSTHFHNLFYSFLKSNQAPHFFIHIILSFLMFIKAVFEAQIDFYLRFRGYL